MTDDLEDRLQRELARADLPRAPETLLAFAEQTGAAELERRSKAPGNPRVMVLFGLLVATVLAGLGLSGLWSGGLRVETSLSPTMTPGSTAVASGGYRRVSVPGVELTVPEDWIDETASAPNQFGNRTAAAFIAGSDECPIRSFDPKTACPTLGDQKSGALVFTVVQYLNPLPGFIGDTGATGGTTPPGSPTTINGQRAWSSVGSTDNRSWTIEGNDRSWYVIGLGIASGAVADRMPQVDQVLAGLNLSDWQASPGPITNGMFKFDEGGIAFDYPNSWRLYFPHNASMVDSSLVMVASNPVAACPGGPCQSYALTDGTVVVEFRIGGVPQDVDWTKAIDRVGSQPAFGHDWTTKDAPAGEEDRGWTVRFGTQPLQVIARVRGPGNTELKAAADELVQSILLSP